ncbi:MAG: MG2 domain-containing protein [Chitinophagales bacterium]|nr:MG2 domain-containing protein [Chitinophagales bacterium]
MKLTQKTATILLTIILLSIQGVMAEQYNDMWKKYSDLESKGFNKDALQLAQLIYNKAQSENVTEQKFKALIHIYKNQLQIEENSEVKIIQDLKSKISNSKSIDEKALLKMLLARSYFTYYIDNQYSILDRTFSEELSDDFTMWDAKQFQSQIHSLYMDILNSKNLLKEYSLKNYSSIIMLQDENMKFNIPIQNLSDLLYLEAINFYKSKNIQLIEAAHAFQINQKEYFFPITQFVNLPIQSQTFSNELYALQLFQQWAKEHINDSDKELLSYIDYERLRFVNENFLGENKLDLYSNSLKIAFQQSVSKSSQSLFNSELLFHQYNNRLELNIPLKEIVLKAEKHIKDYHDTYGAALVQTILDEIFNQSLQVRTEEFIPSYQDFKVWVQYKNIDGIQYKIIEWNPSYAIAENNSHEKIWNNIQKTNSIQAGSLSLPASNDYLQHSIEFAFKGLSTGKYALVTFTNDISKQFNKSKFTITPFQVTNLSITVNENNKNLVIRILDRKTGFPIQNCSVEILKLQRDKEPYQTIYSGFPNSKSELNIEKTSISNSFFKIIIKKGRDTLTLDNQYFHYYNNHFSKNWNTTARIFTDRAIYRQGQEIYFKGILISSDGDTVKPSTQQTLKVTLRDANYQEVSTQNFTTNEYGSFSGFFKIPLGGLNGNFTIETDYGSANISVEDYKRPTFEVKILPVEGAFQLDDNILIKGQAIAYSGASISQAEVTYSIKRQAYYPIWRMHGKYFPQYALPAIIATQKITTDKNGEFEITFKAEKDKNNLSTYQYSINVEVTDITGETRSTSYDLRVGKNAIEPQMNIDAIWTPSTAPSLFLSSKNLQNVPVTSLFHLKIESLTPPKYPQKARYWAEPDQYSMTELEHQKRFPYDIFAKDNSPENWVVKAKEWESKIEVSGDSTYHQLPTHLKEGMYKISSTIINKSDTIVLVRYFEIKQALAPSIQPEFIKVSLDKSNYQTKDSVTIAFHSDIQPSYVNAFITVGGEIISDTSITLNGKSVVWNVPFQIRNRDIVTIFYEIIVENRVIRNSLDIPVQYPKWDDLNIRWQTFRDKLLPGSHEKWTLKITDAKNQLAKAELLATMYDASLDQFASNDFNFYLPFAQNRWVSYLYYANPSFRLSNTLEYQGQYFNSYPNYVSLFSPEINYFNWRLGFAKYYYRHFADGGGMPAPMMMEKSLALGGNNNDSAETPLSQEEVKNENNTSKSIADPAIFRTNFSETAFFYPFLYADSLGEYSIDFTIPDALTTWKFLAFAHTPDLHYNIFQDKVKTQKDIMIQLNKPRFVRKGDIIYLKAKVSNLTDNQQQASINILFRNAYTKEDITSEILKSSASIQRLVPFNSNISVEWKIEIPNQYDAIIYEVSVTTPSFSDGEKDIIPILENQILLTKSTPIFINKKGKYSWDLKDVLTKTPTSNNKMLSFEYTSMPVWNALMALPYLNEQNDESALALFDRYYANTLASYILREIPESKKLLEAWGKEGSLKSALEKNQELKSIILEATPWLRDAQDETAQMQQLYKLLSEADNSNIVNTLLGKLQKLQNPSGGISWFLGMPQNRYITQYILLGLFRLNELGAIQISSNTQLKDWVNLSVKYLDKEVEKKFLEIKQQDSNYLSNDHLDDIEIENLYLNSYFNTKITTEAAKYFYQQSQKYGFQKSNHAKALIAMTLNRLGDRNNALLILKSLKQSAVFSEKEGMYWKSNNWNYWYNSPIETQAHIILAFQEINKNDKDIDYLKLWLLRQKQSNRWEQPRATANACYALLLTGSDWKSVSTDVIKIDNQKILNTDLFSGTAYFKKSWSLESGEKQPQTIDIRKKQKSPSWGAIYQQYWEDLSNTESQSNEDLKIKRTLYKVIHNEQGEELIPITPQTPIFIGDQLKIKLELKINRDLEFFHLQDTRASGFEPKNLLSGYRYQGGLWYYEVNGDAATHWFLENIKKGNYIFEYSVNINVAGKYSSGVTIGECLYAPEYRFHSNGTIFEIKQ